jgi:hypothetical protein
MSTREIVRDYGPLIGPLVGLLGVATTLWINARRADRERRREMHARAISAVVAYLEMPYAIRRRRHEKEHASAERVRLSDAFRSVQADLACAEAIMRTDPDASVQDAYARLVVTLREDAGGQATQAWNRPPIERDDHMSLGDVHTALERARAQQHRFEQIAAASNQPPIRRLLRRSPCQPLRSLAGADTSPTEPEPRY